MSPTCPDRITLTAQRRELARLVRAGRTEQRWSSAPDRARRRGRIIQRADRGVAGGVRGHRAQVARPLVRRTGGGLAGRRATIRSPTGVHSGAGRRGQGAGLQAAGRDRVAAVAVVLPGPGAAGRRRGICAAISPSTVRRWLSEDALKPWQYQSWIFITDPDFAAKATAGAGPLRPHLGRETIAGRRVRHLRRREDLHPGPLPLPPHPAARRGPHDAGQPRIRPRRRGGLPGRLRRAPRHGVRPLRAHHRDRPVLPWSSRS